MFAPTVSTESFIAHLIDTLETATQLQRTSRNLVDRIEAQLKEFTQCSSGQRTYLIEDSVNGVFELENSLEEMKATQSEDAARLAQVQLTAAALQEAISKDFVPRAQMETLQEEFDMLKLAYTFKEEECRWEREVHEKIARCANRFTIELGEQESVESQLLGNFSLLLDDLERTLDEYDDSTETPKGTTDLLLAPGNPLGTSFESGISVASSASRDQMNNKKEIRVEIPNIGYQRGLLP